MTNLLEETQEAITSSGHTTRDVQFVGSEDGRYQSTWDQFANLADVEYHSGYGSAEVATDLIVQFYDGRKMWRTEYDGSEAWDYDRSVEPFTGTPKPLEYVVGQLWPSLEVLHSDDENDEPYQRRENA